MSLAGLDLLLGARVPFLAAALLAGCSGADDDASVAGPIGDATREGGVDAPADTSPAEASLRVDGRSVSPGDASIDAARDASSSTRDGVVDAFQPALCLRLADPQDTNRVLVYSQAVDDQFLLFIQADCRVAKALHPPGGTPALAAWRNDLYAWNLDLWGCTKMPAAVFKLVSSDFTGWTNTDAQLLIDAYLRAATRILSLTDGEAADLHDDLERLAAPLVTNDASDSTLSTCPVDASANAEADAPVVDANSANAEADAPTVETGSADADSSSIVESGPGDADSALEEGGD